MTDFIELRAHTAFSFSDGACTPEALVARVRRKVGAETIGTRRGHGYIMETPSS